MATRASYHTTLKELTHYGLLPPKYEKMIPRTNLYRWKNDENINRFVGSGINQVAEKHKETIMTLNEFPVMFYAYARLISTVVGIVRKTQDYTKLVRDSKEEVVKAIDRVKEHIPVEKAVKMFSISRATFYIWSSDIKHKCEKSYFNRCNRIYSGQIMPGEIENVKECLTDPATSHWSMKSIYYNGIRKKKISVSLNTLYMINRRLKIRDTIGNRRKKKKPKTGIRAAAPNQIWHADITVLKTLDGVKQYIYLVIDNYSRKILSYEVCDKVSGLVRLSTLEESYEKAKGLSENLNVKLIVDGGSENNNIHIENFINRSEINMEKLIALKDIDYSNSMVEATNKTIKYRYLFPDHPHNKDELISTLSNAVHDFNDVCPHGQLKGLTPNEAWRGVKSIDNLRTQLLQQAKIDRLEYNRTNVCRFCST